MSQGTWISSIDVKKNKLTGPNALESQLRAELSPSTQQCPSGILVSLRDPGICIHSPGSPINLFTNNCLWLLGHLWAHGEWSAKRTWNKSAAMTFSQNYPVLTWTKSHHHVRTCTAQCTSFLLKRNHLVPTPWSAQTRRPNYLNMDCSIT